MNVSNGIENLSQIVTPQATPAASVAKSGVVTHGQAPGEDQAQLSAVGTQVAQSAKAPDVRLDKVAAIQSALQAGTYHVPAADVAQRVIASMLGIEK
jgi:flagellar biosynthesis anti-sigma factor FlgM